MRRLALRRRDRAVRGRCAPGRTLVAIALLAAACGGQGTIPVSVELTSLPASACSGGFVGHDLDHVTRGPNTVTTLFDGTGAGVGMADFDGDGTLDIALANLAGYSTMLMNQGQLVFETQELIQGRFRQVAPVDIDADGRVDLALSTGVGTPILMYNHGDRFEREPLAGVQAVAYSLAWGDLQGDGGLDLVTGSYNAELTADQDFVPIAAGRSGVFVYEQSADGFSGQALATDAQALALLLADVTGDEATDIVVGNDLLTPDAVFRNDDGLWVVDQPFAQTTFSTMSLDAADFDNDGDDEVIATDMYPMSDDSATMAIWENVFEDMAAQPLPPGDPQIQANMLQVADDGFENASFEFGFNATGWSWSGLFGDLDNDGWLDVYVVNGMTSPELFPTLPNFELVEPNQAFRNVEGAGLVSEPDWGLAAPEGGRGMTMGDIDRDGDLDIVINNLNAPARLFENQLCGGSGITVDLVWEGVSNRAGLGSRLVIDTAQQTLSRTVTANRGYLSGGPTQVHFGVANATSSSLTVVWPDGETSVVPDIEPNTHVHITREAAERS